MFALVVHFAFTNILFCVFLHHGGLINTLMIFVILYNRFVFIAAKGIVQQGQ